MNGLPSSPAFERNRDPILEVLKKELLEGASVLEVGSGTGQHAVYFAAAMKGLSWQPSERRENIGAIERWIEHAQVSNVLRPLELDVASTPPFSQKFDAVFSANTAHIMSEPEVEAMLQLVGDVLPGGGLFLLYGPFNLDGDFTSESNRQFDASLRSRKATMGIRDIDWMNENAAKNGLVELRRYAMPANNMLLVWQKRA